ncbi:MAG: HEAT repeat domain-containing protein [Planctomycetota bacterium]
MLGWLLVLYSVGSAAMPPARGFEPATAAPETRPGPQTQPAPESRPTEAELPLELKRFVDELAAADSPTRVKAIEGLLNSRDPRAIAPLVAALARLRPDDEAERRDWDRERVGIVRGISTAFPERALSTFREVLATGAAPQREAVTFGLGQLDDREAIETLLPLLGDDQADVRRAAGVSVIVQAREAVEAATRFVNGQGPGVPKALLDQFDRIRAGIVRQASSLASARELADSVRKVGDASSARALHQVFAKELGAEGAELADRLGRMLAANRRWLGWAEPVAAQQVSYRFEMQNLIAKKGKSFQVTFGPREQELLRYRGYHLDRATHLELTLDELLSNPAACEPRLEADQDGNVRIRYAIPPRVGLTVSMGAMNIAYWQGKCFRGRTASLLVDAVRSVPLSEQIFGEGGELLANIDYSSYAEVAPGTWVPLAIHVELLATDEPRRHMLYDLSFTIREPGVWLFRSGTAQEVDEDGIQPRATAQLANVEVVPR